MNAIQQALDCLKNGNRSWEAMEILEKAMTKNHDALREALEMIAGDKQCPDSLMSNQDIARAALSQPMPEAAAQGETPNDFDQELTQALEERDAAEDMADQLAAQIAAITGEEIGEHSSANNPWRNAMLVADEWIANDIRRLFRDPESAAPAQPQAQGEPEDELTIAYMCGVEKGKDYMRKALAQHRAALEECVRQLVWEVGSERQMWDEKTAAAITHANQVLGKEGA